MMQKVPRACDLTGYGGATTNAYAAGAVIINEIMWGLDAGEQTASISNCIIPTAAASRLISWNG